MHSTCRPGQVRNSPLDQGRARRHDVLAVVEQEQQVARAQVIRQPEGKGPLLPPGLGRVGAGSPLPHAEDAGHDLRHELGLSRRREVHQPHAVVEVLYQLGRELKGQLGLTHTPTSREGAESIGHQGSAQLYELSVTADEGSELKRKVVGIGVERLQEAGTPLRGRDGRARTGDGVWTGCSSEACPDPPRRRLRAGSSPEVPSPSPTRPLARHGRGQTQSDLMDGQPGVAR